ncbi:MAG: asparagine synthase (glutamine-hydrolyzing) [Oscillospiraceae bacterium]|jgi:asparagine synthase (glutamine-hydrolysing)|nr:asparagine synthase (glutamine-hydrolyzing) [Oscillospiraceae bacterium]
MCGIAGWIDFTGKIKKSGESLKKMSAALERRGPDEHGEYYHPRACLLHRRLTVIDAQGGKQPMSRKVNGAGYIISYNGELYNTDELREELVKKGFVFKGYSDTEVLLNAYIYWGESCLDRLNGIYAFAVWNSRDETVFLARDKAGVKPLFFSRLNQGLLFASEIKALLAHEDIKPRLSRSGIAEIFLLGPGRTPGQGVLDGIEELPAGHFAQFSKDGLKIKRYFKLEAREHCDSFDRTVETVRELVSDSVRRQLVSDAPLCTFLSGGLDSSIITHIASERYQKRGKILSTYSVDYENNAKYFKPSAFQPNSDNYYIALMAQHSKTRHKRLVLKNRPLYDALGPAAIARDMPGMADVDSSLLLFSKEIKKNFTVALSGECADEIFGGYPWYHNAELRNARGFPWSSSTDLRFAMLKKGILGGLDPDEYIMSRYYDSVNRASKLPADSEEIARNREMFMLNIEWFMQTLLDRKDRMTMYSALEVRVPFCDWRIMDYMYNVPPEMRDCGGREKGLLRKSMAGILPEEVLCRKKSPYPKTFHPEYERLLRERLYAIAKDKSSPILQIADREKLFELAQTSGGAFARPWYGQLMTKAQVMAYMIQLNIWLNDYNIEIAL